MKLKKIHKENKAILIDDSGIKSLDKFISQYFKRIKYSATCQDETEIEFENLSELLEYENPNHRRIIGINVFAKNKEDRGAQEVWLQLNPEFKLKIGGSYSYQTLEYVINSDDYKNATAFETELKQRLKLIRPWYWFISKTSFNLVIGLLCFGYSIFSGLRLLYNRINGIDIKYPESNLTITEWLAVLAIIFLFYFGLIYILNKIKNYLFPKVIIRTGIQKKKDLKKNKLVYFIFAVVILSIIVNLLSSWIWQLMGK